MNAATLRTPTTSGPIAVDEPMLVEPREPETTLEFCNSCDAMVLPGGYCNCR